MSGADKDQKTHDATDKKLSDARAKGDVARSPEMRHAATFAAAIVVTGGLGLQAIVRLGAVAKTFWAQAYDIDLAPAGMQAFATGLLLQIGSALAPLFGVLLAFAVLGSLLQGRPTFTWSRLAPQWSKLSPVAGFKRIFGPRAFIEFGKTLGKLVLVVGIAWFVLRPRIVGLDQLVGASPRMISAAASGLVATILKAVALLVGSIAAFDFVFQRRAWLIKMRMSLQEIKDEHKQSEGDPKIKAKIRAIAMQRSRRRMMSAVPTASVVITNPTHYAVALKYDHGVMAAPVVVAKGVDAIALKIREVAGAANVPIVENRALARALYASVDIDHPVSAEYYTAVAEIIGFVMRIAKRQA